MGPMPRVEELHSDDLPQLQDCKDDDEDDEATTLDDSGLEKGDRIFAAIPPPTPEYLRTLREEHIRASETVSQRLALAFQRNKPHDPRNSAVPDFLQEFEDVFARSPLMNCPCRVRGTMPLSYWTERNQPLPSATRCLRRSRNSWTNFWKKISGLVGSAPVSRPLPLQCSLSRRRTDRSAWSRTTGSSTI